MYSTQIPVPKTITKPSLASVFKEDKERKAKRLTFSFCFFDRTHEAFNLGNTKEGWYLSMLDAIKDWSRCSWPELQKLSIYDPHPSSSGNFPFPFTDANQYECRQIRINKGSGRVHGFILESVFYIIWFDPHHNMTDSEGYPGVTYHPKPYNEFEELQERCFIYEQDLLKAKTELDEFLSYCDTECPDKIKNKV